MQLRLGQLRSVVKKVMNEQKVNDILRSELRRVLGPTALVEGDIHTVARSANDTVDANERVGYETSEKMGLSLLLKLIEHSDAEVRKLAVKLLPTNHVSKLLRDKDESVRHAAARRLPISELKSVLKRFSNDDEFRLIYRNKKLLEEAKEVAETSLTGDVVKQWEGPELSATYYDTLARKFVQDYGNCWQTNWPMVVKRYVASSKATSGTDIDAKKLKKAIDDVMKEREDDVIKESLGSTLKFLRSQFDVVEETIDPVKTLLETHSSAGEYVSKFSKVFSVLESMIPATFKMYMVNKPTSRPTMVPQRAKVPHAGAINENDERALDKFVSSWNKRQETVGEPMRISWYIDPCDASKAGFNIILK